MGVLHLMHYSNIFLFMLHILYLCNSCQKQRHRQMVKTEGYLCVLYSKDSERKRE